MNKNTIKFIFSSVLLCGALSFGIVSKNIETKEEAAYAAYTNGDGATYYSSIASSLTGTSLTNALSTLNNTKLQRRVGYDNMKQNYSYTDYDPAKGYGSKYLLSFYSGKSAVYSGNMNREHTWPASRTVEGRDKDPLEDDIHMTRPTLTSENSDRGNSFFAASGAWDPASFGNESYRGDAARIIMYCTIADTRLKIIDKTSDYSSNHTMGKLSDLLEWNFKYPVAQREKNRNEGAEGLQGNRNPFIDHPEFAAYIWGNYNSTTKAICEKYNINIDGGNNRDAGSIPTTTDEKIDPVTPDPTPAPSTDPKGETLVSLEVTSPDKTTYQLGEEFDPTGMEISAIFSGGTKVNVDINSTRLTITGYDPNKTGTQTITIKYSDLKGNTDTTIIIITVVGSNSSGCNGSIIASSLVVSLSSLIGFSLLIAKKRKS